MHLPSNSVSDPDLECSTREPTVCALAAGQRRWHLQIVSVSVSNDRSNSAVALLGVLKAGAAYVPLDPAYPAERLSFMAEDADVKFVLADQNPAAKALPNREVILDLQECLATANSLSGTTWSYRLRRPRRSS